MAFTDCSPWPKEDQQKYYQAGYWQSQTLGQLLHNWADSYSDKIALVDGVNRWSFKTLNLKASWLATGFYKLGIKRGDRVLMQLPNSNHFVAVLFALLRVGALPILTMPAQRENDISALCKLAEPVAYIFQDKFLGFDYLGLAEKMQAQHTNLKHLIVSGNSSRFTPLADLEETPIALPVCSPTDPALLLLSGGTTGTPKLIPRSHTDYAYNARASAQLCELSSNTVYLAALPVAHNFPLACPGILGTLGVGGTVVMAKTPGNDETFPLIEQEKVTMTSLVPPLVQLWLCARDWDTTDISSLRLLQVGGARFESSLAKQVAPVLGCKLQQVFGMAEGLLCYTRLNDPEEVVIHTQGRPLCPDDEIRIVDSDGSPVAQGEVGELHTKGPYTLRGYYRAEQHNAKAFTTEGFYQSGDLVRMSETGNIVVEGRLKEQINRAGEKIAVAEIEQLLNEHPQIDSSTLIPVPDDRLGERSCAFVITHDVATQATLTLQDIQRYLSDKGLPRYKLPDQLKHMIAWPLTAVGKINKKQLISLATDQAEPDTVATYIEHCIKITADPMNIALKLIQSGLSNDYAIYEHNGEWSVGIGKYATITADKEQAFLNYADQRTPYRNERLCTAIAEAASQVPVKDWRAYGTAKFELSHVFYNIDLNHPKKADTALLELFIPRYEIRIHSTEAQLRVIDACQLEKLTTLVQQIDKQLNNQHSQQHTTTATTPVVTNIHHQQSEYKASVQKAVQEINDGHYQKVILSRSIPLPAEVDLIHSYRNGRKQNTPARSFLLNFSGVQLAGFSPETVVEVSASGWVNTQPLAGTRALGDNPQEEELLREELQTDTKEIAEHAVSVKLAQEELSNVCDSQSIAVSEFMTVSRRGSVQHLASRVKGKLISGKHAWDAFEALFPAVTASGIPKKTAIEAIHRHEPEQREWYSGCVMIVDSDGAMDAALVLRSIYQRGEKCWLQAGAGIIDQSIPERELQETIEKLSCLSQHLTSEQADSEKNRNNKQTELV